jgi:hypothetical protein
VLRGEPTESFLGVGIPSLTAKPPGAFRNEDSTDENTEWPDPLN